MTIAEQLKNEINLQKDIPWLKEEVMSQIRGRGMFSIICDTHIRDVTKFSLPYKYNSSIQDWARQEGLNVETAYNNYGVKHIRITL